MAMAMAIQRMKCCSSNVLCNFVKIPPDLYSSNAESIRRKRLILPKSSRTLHNYMFLLCQTEARSGICNCFFSSLVLHAYDVEYKTRNHPEHQQPKVSVAVAHILLIFTICYFSFYTHSMCVNTVNILFASFHPFHN